MWAFQRRLDQALARHQNQRELAPAEALELMDCYFSLKSLESFAPWLDAAIAADDEPRSIIDTNVLIKTKQGGDPSWVYGYDALHTPLARPQPQPAAG